MRDNIVKEVKSFFEDRVLPDMINETNIVLIPKVRNPISMEDCRPISLCNVRYKIISKVMANKLKMVFKYVV